MIKNRLEKNWKKLGPWSRQFKIEAFRLYDHDIPEFPVFVDKYQDYWVVYDRTDTRDIGKNQVPQVVTALIEIFSTQPENIIVKKRFRQKDDSQYTRLDKTDRFIWVQESQARLCVNLWDYLDTGLFLDHRPIRQHFYKTANGKRFLNLFCYTGSVSVFAALGGAQTTSVDMSATYVDWAKENFKGNAIDLQHHRFLQENVLEYLESPIDQKFDIIFLDPPTFSNSKRMDGSFEVERDQVTLIEKCMRRLDTNGILYFSNNKQGFRLNESLKDQWLIKEITEQTIPRDFHDKKVHRCYEIRKLTSRP